MLRPLLAALALLTLPAAAQLVPEGATVEKVADGYKFTEGPAVGPDGCIYFTDIPAELILKYDPETGETVTFRENTGQANGLMWFEGDLYMCCHKARALHFYPINENWQNSDFEKRSKTDLFSGPRAVIDPQTPLVIASYIQSRDSEGQIGNLQFNSPNDLAIDQIGNIYFTDPRYGNRDSMQMSVEGVYFYPIEARHKLFANSESIVLDPNLTRPNGIVLSPDESILYVADNAENWIYAYDIVEPGKVQNKRQFARLNDGKGGGSDGMCVDAKGRLYATGHGKVWVFEPNGELVTTIDVGPQTTNCTFGQDGKTLYITANKGLYRIELSTEEPLSAITVDYDRTGVITVEGKPVELDELTDAIRSVPGFSTERQLYLRVDAAVYYKQVTKLLEKCQMAGFETIEIVARPFSD